MTYEAALRKYAEPDWPEHKECEDHEPPHLRHGFSQDAEWGIVRFPVRHVRVVEDRAQANQQNDLVELRRLADEWKAATLYMSSTPDQFLHPAYQQIIGFGEKALPFLIEELRTSDDYWFWALSMITRDNPVDHRDVGNYRAMKEAWLDWAERHHL